MTGSEDNLGGLGAPQGSEAAPDLTAAAVDVMPPEIVAGSLTQYLRAWALRVRSGDAGILPVVAALVLVTVVFQIVSPAGRFLSAGNLVNLFIQSSVFIVLAMGEGFVLLLGEIDLSMGYVGAIGGIIAANMVQPGNSYPWWAAIIVGLAACAFIGMWSSNLWAITQTLAGPRAAGIGSAAFAGWSGRGSGEPRRTIMAIKGEWIKYGDQVGYFAIPERAATPLPSVVVIQEIGGVNDHIEDVTRRIAAAGYAALAPDIFAVNGTRPEALRKERVSEAFAFMATMPPASRFDPAVREAAMAKLPEEQRARIGESFAKVWSMVNILPSFVAPLRRAVQFLRTERPETREQKLGCVGFCMGGGLSALLACEEGELSGAAMYYGGAPAEDKISALACPVIAFYGGNDQRVNAGIPAFEAAMKKEGKSFEHRVYEGANHAFFNDDGPGYDVKASRDSFARLLAFFAKNLSV